MQVAKPKKGYKLVKTSFGKYEIPEEWKVVTIKDLIEKIIDNRGKTPPLSDEGRELVEIQSVTNESMHPDYSKVKKYVDENTFNTWFRDGHPEPNDILVSTVGSVGQYAIMKESRGCIAQNLIALRIREPTNPVFIYYALNTNYVYVQTQSVLMNGLQPSLKVPHFLGFDIYLPSSPEQQKISSVLSNVDDTLQKTDQIIEQTQRLKTGMMQKLLTRGIGHTKFKKVKWLYGKYVEIPEEWDVVKIGQICESIVSGRNKPKKFVGDIPWITLPDIDSMYVRESKSGLQVSTEEIKKCGGKILPPNAVIMTCVGDLGMTAITSQRLVVNQQLHAFICPKNIDPYFIATYLKNTKKIHENYCNFNYCSVSK